MNDRADLYVLPSLSPHEADAITNQLARIGAIDSKSGDMLLWLFLRPHGGVTIVGGVSICGCGERVDGCQVRLDVDAVLGPQKAAELLRVMGS